MHPSDTRNKLLLPPDIGISGLEAPREPSELFGALYPSSTRCPFIGLATDEGTAALFAAEEQRCYRAHQAQRIPLITQSQVCLTFEHTRCPVFRGERNTVVAGKGGSTPRKLRTIAGCVAALLVAVVVATFAASGRVSVSASISVTTPPSDVVTQK